MVPSGAKQGGGGNGTQSTGARKVCAGADCGNPIPKKRFGGKIGGLDRFCTGCRAGIEQFAPDRSQPSTGNLLKQQFNEQGKRAHDTISPVVSPLEPKKTRFSAMGYDFSIFLSDLESADKCDLIERVRKLVSIGQSCVTEMNSSASALKRTEDAFNAYKVAFADDAFRSFTARSLSTANGSSASTESSTLVVTVNEAAMNEEVNAQVMDRLLDATDKGPVPQTVRQKEGKVYISFSDAVQCGKAKSMIETKPECKLIFETANTQTKLFPAIALHVDLTDLESLKKELVFRNPVHGSSIKQFRTIFRSTKNPSGHIKILFDSRRARDEVINRGVLFAFGRRIQIVPVDPNREVRRCYRCQSYGHIAKSASNECSKEEMCGFCAGQHSTRDCARVGKPKCANCSSAHRAGDPSCSHQVRAVSRYRAVFEQ